MLGLHNKESYASSFSVNKFNSELHAKGVFKPYYFLVVITPPVNRYIDEIFNSPSMTMRIESTALPTRTLATIEQNYYGPRRLIPYRYTSTPLRLSVMMSEDARERELFSRWQDMLIGRSRTNPSNVDENQRNKFNSHYYDDAAKNCKIEIHAFAESPKFQGESTENFFTEVVDVAAAFGFDLSIPTAAVGLSGIFPGIRTQKIYPVFSVTFNEIYPATINELNLDWGETNTYGKLQVELNYRYFEENHYLREGADDSKSFAQNIRSTMRLFNTAKDFVGIVRRQGVSGAINQVGTNIMSGPKALFRF